MQRCSEKSEVGGGGGGGTKSKHINGSKECYLLGQKHNLQIFGVIPFVRLQNDTF